MAGQHLAEDMERFSSREEVDRLTMHRVLIIAKIPQRPRNWIFSVDYELTTMSRVGRTIVR